MAENWYSLDNAGKIFPAIKGKKYGTCIFNLCAKLKCEINPDIMQKTVNDVLKRFPSFKVRLKKGVFWYYLEENKKPYIISALDPNLIAPIDEFENNNYLFKISIYKNSVFLSVFHSLTDANGAMEFLKTIIYYYLIASGCNIKRDRGITPIEVAVSNKEVEDNFLTYSKFKNKVKPEKERPAYKISGTPFNYDGCGVIIGKVNLEELKELTAKYDTTVSCYMSAVLIYTIYNLYVKNNPKANRYIVAALPVNMRKWFNSNTLRNFIGFIRLKYDFSKDITFEELLKLFKKQMSEKLNKERLQAQLTNNVKIEKNFFLRILPLFLKDVALKLGYGMLGDDLHSVSFSNIGKISLSSSLTEYVEDLFFIQGGGRIKFNCSVLGYKDTVNVNFSRLFVESNIEKEFFRHFTERGVHVEIISNYWEKQIWSTVMNVK